MRGAVRKFRVYDKPSFGDRYTLCIREPETRIVHFWGCSVDPRGMSYYCGSTEDGKYRCGSHLGKKVRNLADLPDAVKNWFIQLAKESGWDEKDIVLA